MFFLVPRVNPDGTWFDALESHRTQSVNIEFTSDCNLRCSYCAVSLPSYAGADMSPETIELLHRGLANRQLEIVTLNGHGETTMIPGWPRKLKPFIDNFPVGMTSNFARQFSPEELDAFARFKSINISLDTADPVLLKRIRRSVSLDQILDNLANIRAAADRLNLPGPAVYIFCTVYDQNVLHLEDLGRLAVSLRVTGVIFGNLMKHSDVAGACNVQLVTNLGPDHQQQARRSIESTITLLREHGITVSSWGDSIETIKQRITDGDAGEATYIASAIENKVAVQGPDAWKQSIIELCDSEETRGCLDPWLFTQVDANANVLPCCIHTPVGVLNTQHPLDVVLNNDTIRQMRTSLLLGRLDPECTVCPTRRKLKKSELRRRYVSLVILPHRSAETPTASWQRTAKGLVAGGTFSRGPMRIVSSALRRVLRTPLLNRAILRLDPGVIGHLDDHVQFENVAAWQFAISDRVYLHPNPPHKAPATVRFRDLPLQDCSSVDLYLYKDNEMADAVQFELSISDSRVGQSVHEATRVVRQRVEHWVIGTSPLNGRYDLTLRTSMAPGATSNRFAWAYIGYPIFL
jgi:MoaA/NifB/PqqE/SkfB family radical SAM enzyme